MKQYLLILFLILLFTSFSFALTSTIEQRQLDRGCSFPRFCPAPLPTRMETIEPSTYNIEVYNEQTRTANIFDSEENLLANITLLTPVHNQVGLGYQKVAEMEINSQIEYDTFFNSIYTFDLTNNSLPIEKEFDVKEKILVSIEEPTYENQCQNWDGNGAYCKIIQNGTQTINQEQYIPFDETTTWIGTKTISLWTETQPNESIEWIPDLFGTTINEWASWTADLNTSLIGYWKLDETTGTTVNNAVAGGVNGTNTNLVPINQSGIINTSYGSFTTNKYITLGSPATNFPIAYNQPFSISAWVYPNSFGGLIFSQSSGANKFQWYLDNEYTASKLEFGIAKSSVASYNAIADSNTPTGQWVHVVGTFSGTGDANGIKLYVNGVLQTTKGTYGAGAISNSDGETIIGNSTGYSTGFKGKIDESAIWTRVLTQTEVTTLWNGGLGLPFNSNNNISSQITFNILDSNTHANLTGIGFDANVNLLDLANQSSPFNTIYYDQNTNVSAVFTSTTGYDSNTYKFVMDSNKTLTVYLTANPSPVTTMAYTIPDNNNTATVTLTCTDSVDTCSTTKYEYDLNGTWFTYTTPFNFTGVGNHKLRYYSTSTRLNVEAAKTSDLNMPIFLTIKYPKNIQTLLQLTEKWTLSTTGGIILNLTDLNSDRNFYIQPNITTTFYVSDVNGNYTQSTFTRTYYADSNNGTTDTLQPYLYAILTSLATTINVQNKNSLAPIPNIVIKFYGNLPGIGNTLIGQGTTDSKGQILQLFIAGQNYTFDVYNGITLLQTYNYLAIKNETFLYFNFTSLDVNNNPPITITPHTDLNTSQFYTFRNTLFNSCHNEDPCFPSALIAIIITIIVLIAATSTTTIGGTFIGIKGLSIIAFCCFTIFLGIGFLPLFIYAFLGTITLLMAVVVQ